MFEEACPRSYSRWLCTAIYRPFPFEMIECSRRKLYIDLVVLHPYPTHTSIAPETVLFSRPPSFFRFFELW